jgi:hypothetical protein
MLYVLAGLLVFVAIVLFGVVYWRRQQEDERSPYAVPVDTEASDEDDLRSLGIMDIRPRERRKKTEAGATPRPKKTSEQSTSADAMATPVASSDTEKSTAAADEDEWAPVADSSAAPETAAAGDMPVQEASPDMTATDEEMEEIHEAATGEGTDDRRADTAPADAPANAPAEPAAEEHPVLLPLLRSLRNALSAHTACLLKQEELALTYEVQALDSADPEALRSGTFSTRKPLLSATMSQRRVSVRHVGAGGLPHTTLGFYKEPVHVAEVGLAPIERPNSTSTYFLLVDALAEEALGTQRGRTILAQYAQLLGTVLEDDETPAPAAHATQNGTTEASEEQMRPRREIIAEEIMRAEAADAPLGLALVHLRDAEVVADDGLGAIRRAERALQKRLEKASPDARIERFGECMFGVFHRAPISELEHWAADLQQFLAAEDGLLSGGVNIGVAMLGDRHGGDPDTFRADATTALREAYETGAATLIE